MRTVRDISCIKYKLTNHILEPASTSEELHGCVTANVVTSYAFPVLQNCHKIGMISTMNYMLFIYELHNKLEKKMT